MAANGVQGPGCLPTESRTRPADVEEPPAFEGALKLVALAVARHSVSSAGRISASNAAGATVEGAVDIPDRPSGGNHPTAR